jgi:DNA-binding transcriptional MerR regulator
MLIGEVSRRAGISTRMLRHYDSIGLVTPTGRTTSGYRDYLDADIRRLFQVESLRSLGLPLQDVRRALDDPTIAPSLLLDELIEDTRERIARDEQLLHRLRQVQASDVSEWTDVASIVAMIRELRADDPSRRQRGALSTAGTGGRMATVLAEALLSESDPHAAGALRWALQRGGEDALAVLTPALQAPDAAVRARAVAALAELPSDDATAALVVALDNGDADVRRSAALGLGRRGDTTAVATLVAMIVDGVNDVEAAELLGGLAVGHELGDEVAELIAGQLASAETSPDARSRLTQSLAEIPGRTAERTLRALQADADLRVARTSIYILEHRQET